MVEVSRRKFIRLGAGAAALSTLYLIGCRPESGSSTPDIEIPRFENINSRIHVGVLKQLQDSFTTNIGIERIHVFSLKNPSHVYLLFELASNAEPGPVVVGQERGGDSPSGFIPFDSTFNTDNAISSLEQQNKKSIKALPKGDPQDEDSLSFLDQYAEKPGFEALHPNPPLNTDLMYLFGKHMTLVNGQPSPPSILKARFRFKEAAQASA